VIKLNEKQEIILMHIRDGKSQREIARITGKDRKTIRKYIKEYEENRRILIEHGGADDKEIINAIVDKPKYDVMPDAIDNLELLEERIKRQELEVEGEIVKYNNIKDMMELDIKTAEIQIENLQTELEKTKLVSPVTGRVVWITSSKVGEYIYAHSNLIRIADVTRLKLRYTGDSISDFKMGDKVEVKIDNDEYVGIVVMTPSTAPFDADDSIKKSVLIDVKGLPAEVKLGDAARISLLLDRRDDVIVIPRDLLHGFMGQKTVYILDDGIKKDRNVQVGIETPTEVEIVKGLEEGEEIIEN
jgi:macrolide-specific efflux system membrane fusion protein